MEKKKRWIIQIVIFICFIMLGRQIIGSKAMISEMIDGYYQGVFGGFCPVLLKKEETIKETILSDMIRIYYPGRLYHFYNIGQTIKTKKDKILYRKTITIFKTMRRRMKLPRR